MRPPAQQARPGRGRTLGDIPAKCTGREQVAGGAEQGGGSEPLRGSVPAISRAVRTRPVRNDTHRLGVGTANCTSFFT